MGDRAHSRKCSEDKSGKPCQCKTCHGALHGWEGAAEYSYLTLSSAATASRRAKLLQDRRKPAATAIATRAADAGPKVTTYLTTKMLTWHLEHDWPETDRDAALSCLSDVFSKADDAMLDAIARQDGLNGSQRRRLVAAVRDGHVLCSLCAGTLRMLRRLKEAAKVTAEAVAGSVVDAAFELTESDPDDAEQAALRRVCVAVAGVGAEHVVDTLVGKQHVLALRIAGAMSCPDWATHPGDTVWTECVKPLAAKALSDAEQAWARKKSDSLTV
ncbi:hypothetical protein ACTJKO_00585 [Curtobacterium sp. 22159]|uniref:hypothetical protein n=1 Tax=Curtobacterium sp. 22159 TaxID=3453882 RepID=UPI003F87694D